MTPSGLVMTPVYRRAYRNGLIEADRGAVERPPNPFEDPTGFETWVEVAEVGSTRLPIYLSHPLDAAPGSAAVRSPIR